MNKFGLFRKAALVVTLSVGMAAELPVMVYAEPTAESQQGQSYATTETVTVGSAAGTTVNMVYGGVNYAPVLDINYYLSTYPDLMKAFGSNPQQAVTHFLNSGMDEGRTGSDSGLFNVYAYANRYPDLQKAFGGDLCQYYRHYCRNGIKEERSAEGEDTKLSFDYKPLTKHGPRLGGAAGYNRSSDSEETSSEAALSSLSYDGVDYSPVFDAAYYLSTYPDLKKAFGDDQAKAFKHFIRSGMREGRVANDKFNVYAYANRYPDLQKAFGSNLPDYYRHYCRSGIKEGRDGSGKDTKLNFVHEENSAAASTSAGNADTVYDGVDYSPVFDANYYLTTYPDVNKAVKGDAAKAFKHFINSGIKEGRRGNAEFNVFAYANRYTDLQKAFSGNLFSYYRHYCKSGKAEGRDGSGNDTALNFSYVADWQNPSDCYQVSLNRVSTPAAPSPFNYVSSNRLSSPITRDMCVNAFVNRAYEYLGTPYVWDYACAPGVGVDCVGLVMQCAYATGMDLGDFNPYNHYYSGPNGWHSHDANNMWNYGKTRHVALSQRQAGDLLSWSGHIAIYIGGDRMIEAWPGAGVRVASMWAHGTPRGCMRLYN